MTMTFLMYTRIAIGSLKADMFVLLVFLHSYARTYFSMHLDQLFYVE